MNSGDKFWKMTKGWIAVIAGIALLGISMIFFVVGFSTGTTIMFGKNNIAMPLAIAISLCNSAIQFVYNDSREDLADWTLWGSSYGVGIGSNYYGLVLLLGIANPLVRNVVALALGATIEIAPEKMIIKGIRAISTSGFKLNFNMRMPNVRPNNNSGGGSGGGGGAGYRPVGQKPTFKPNSQQSNTYRPPVSNNQPKTYTPPSNHNQNRSEADSVVAGPKVSFAEMDEIGKEFKAHLDGVRTQSRMTDILKASEQ